MIRVEKSKQKVVRTHSMLKNKYSLVDTGGICNIWLTWGARSPRGMGHDEREDERQSAKGMLAVA